MRKLRALHRSGTTLGLAVALFVLAFAFSVMRFAPALEAFLSGEKTLAFAQGDLSKLDVAQKGQPAPLIIMRDGEGREVTLKDFRGRYVLLNLWATWCAPCIKEMPSLDRLAALMAETELAIVPVSLDSGGAEEARPFLEKLGTKRLPLYTDENLLFLAALGTDVIPVTVLYDPQGREIARLAGPAEWDGPAAQALIRAALGGALTQPEAREQKP